MKPAPRSTNAGAFGRLTRRRKAGLIRALYRPDLAVPRRAFPTDPPGPSLRARINTGLAERDLKTPRRYYGRTTARRSVQTNLMCNDKDEHVAMLRHTCSKAPSDQRQPASRPRSRCRTNILTPTRANMQRTSMLIQSTDLSSCSNSPKRFVQNVFISRV